MMKRKIKYIFYIGIISFILTLAQPQCDQSLIDNPVLQMCQNCSLATDLSYCQNNCQKGQVQSLGGCLTYCGNLKVAQDQANCDDTIYSCIDGYQWSTFENKCIKYQSFICTKQIYDQNYQILINENCNFMSMNMNNLVFICYGFQYVSVSENKCTKYCGHGHISYLYQSCKSSKLCVDGYGMSYAGNQCKKCEGFFDSDFQIYFCNDCTLASNNLDCFGIYCKQQQYKSSLKIRCMEYCGNGKISDDQHSCQSSTDCVDGFQWNSSVQKCLKICPLISDQYVIQCSNCSLVSDIQYCQNCLNLSQPYYSSQLQKCVNYCGLGQIDDQGNCQTSKLCIDRFIWNIITQKCEQAQNIQCSQSFNQDGYNIRTCQNCALVSELQFCNQSCLSIYQPYYSFYLSKCMYYCGNGLITDKKENCQTSIYCVDGFQWSIDEQKCVSFQQIVCPTFNLDGFNLKRCPNCGLVSDAQYCNNNSICFSQQQPYYSFQLAKCMYYCGNGVIVDDQASCNSQTISSFQCVDGYSWNSQYQKCMLISATCSSNINSPYLKMCSNCSYVTDMQYCSNNCIDINLNYYSNQQNKCMVYCINQVIASNQSICSTSTLCIDGFQWNPDNQKCVKNQQITCSTILPDQYVIQCPNCSLVTDNKYCQNCQLLAKPYYSSKLSKCVQYCGNGIMIDDQGNCQTSNLCIDGFQWKIDIQKCVDNRQQGCSNSFILDGFNLIQCLNCGLVSDNQFCNKSCFSQQKHYYSNYLAKCMYYCGNGVIADDKASCSSQTISSFSCVDGFLWNSQNQKCMQNSGTCTSNINNPYLKMCPNCSFVTDIQYCTNNCLDINLNYYSKQQNRCMAYCKNQVIANNLASCQTSILCIDGFYWDQQQAKCTNNPQGICPALKNNDQYVLQCPNCSLVSNQLPQPNNQCQNICLNSQLPFWDQKQNKCLFYCGNGLIAQAQEYCQSSNICIDGFIYNNKGGCTPLSQNNYNISTTSTVDNGLLVTIIPICVDSLLIILFIIFVFYVIKKVKSVIEKINAVSTQYQSIQQQQQESEKLITKYQQELANANANKKGETNKNDTDVNKIRKSQDLEEQSLSQQTIHKFMKVNNSYEQLPQGSQQQIQQTPQIEIQIDQ
ncbi:hypothetical protein ABPG73_020910 [Tetrahymena malaccensis]